MPGTRSVLRDSLLRRTPVRLALAFTLTVVVAYLVAVAVAYLWMRDDLVRRQDQRIEELFTLLATNTDQGDDAELVEAVRAQIAAAKDGHAVYQLLGPDGAVLATDILPVALPAGWSDQSASVLGRTGDIPYRVLVRKVGADRLAVGRDFSDLDALRETIQTAMLWSSLFALAVALGGGSVIALRIRRRLVAVKQTLDRVAEGDLGARLPLSGADDDIDRVSQQVNAALIRLAALVEGMRQVGVDIAHDLRTPLGRLRNHIAEALEATEQGTDTRPTLEQALAESDAIGNTFSALLRIAQIEAGARRARFAPVDLTATLRSVAEVYAEVAEDADMDLTLHDPGRPVWVKGDAELLVQAFANLVENAICHCPPGAAIRCDLGPEGHQAIVRIVDNGPGIPAQEREKVLRRLYRLERSRTTPGSGLGLSLVKAIADLHGARLSLGDAGPGLEIQLAFDLVTPGALTKL
ncbi:MAG: HAMP domain-containing protein [Rhodobacteraceae bacterium]|nr:HAMP domain-containing protein [Paracoccaceae bacterium]